MVSTDIGRKIFFIYPHSVVKNELVFELMNREFEVYLINDHTKIKSLCKIYKNPIFLINIDEILMEQEWMHLICALKSDKEVKHAQFGVLTYNENIELCRKYLMDLMITCGFITLKLGIVESTDIIIKTLEANEAKGKRRYLGTNCYRGDASFNVTIGDVKCYGEILNISSFGMSFTFDNNFRLIFTKYIPDIQLKLKGFLINVSVEVLGIKEDEGNRKIYLAKFSKSTSLISKSKVRLYISRTLQKLMEDQLDVKFLRCL